MNLTPCPICTVRYGKALVLGSCICNGKVSLEFKPPGRSRYPDFTSTPKTTMTTETGPKISAKEKARLEKAMGRKPV